MELTLRQLVARALADVGEDRRVVVSPALLSVVPKGAQPEANGNEPDVGLVLASAVTPTGEIAVDPLPSARELWAIVPPEHAACGVVDALEAAPTGRVARVYHTRVLAETSERGLVLRKVVKGTSAREVAQALGVPCFAGPDLAEWSAPADS